LVSCIVQKSSSSVKVKGQSSRSQGQKTKNAELSPLSMHGKATCAL